MGVEVYASKCPQCGGVFWCQQHNTLRDISSICLRCGRAFTQIPCECVQDNKGYGIVCITKKNSDKEFISVEFPYEQETINNYLAMLEQDDVDADKSYLTLWDEKSQKIIAVFGSLPPSYDESDFDKE